jgi:hypothetical protein
MTPHITLDPNGTGALYCQHCAELYPPSLPCTVERWIDQCRGFVLMHKHCPKPQEPSKQVELFDELARAEEQRKTAYVDPVAFGIDGMSDAPDPETDPPGNPLQGVRASDWLRELAEDDAEGEVTADGEPLPPPAYSHLADRVDHYAKFHDLYPMPTTLDGLLDACSYGLDGEQFARLREASAGLQPGSVDFAPIANWARREHAHYDSEARVKRGAGPIAGLTIPVQLEMPPALRRLIEEPKKAKRGARPLANPKPRARKSA